MRAGREAAPRAWRDTFTYVCIHLFIYRYKHLYFTTYK